MTVQTTLELEPQMNSAPNAGLDNSHDAPPITNRALDIHTNLSTVPTDNVAIEGALKSEPTDDASIDSRKRDLPGPCPHEEPEPKRLKTSPSLYSNNSNNSALKDLLESAGPTNSFDKETWQGFCEIESDPAYFSAILRDMGVQGVNVREVFSMDPVLLETLPKPIYGLILLYRHRELSTSDQPIKSPGDVWFANQLPAQNSCATLAMINILMNNSRADIGDQLGQFKEFTKDFTPFQRGEAFASFDFVKKIHNSFAKKMDMLEADKHLSYKVNRSKRREKDKKARRKSTDSAATDDSAEGYEDNAHHFIAFVPVGNKVWKLDGLDAQPTTMGAFDPSIGETWLPTVTDTITAIMAAGDDDYGVIAITQSSLLSLRKEACLAINTIQHIQSRLNNVSSDWKSFISDESPPPYPQMLGVEDQLLEHAVSDALTATIAAEQLLDLLNHRSRLLKDLHQIAANIVSEMQTEAEENQKAAQRRFDCGPVIKMWMEMLAGNGYLEGNLDRFMPVTTRDKKAKK
jgi:ubiquitin carboxyl-terminal hydrolase L5